MSEDIPFKDKIKTVGVVGHRVVGDRFQRDRERYNDRELAAYRQARREGMQPDGTRMHQIDRAKALSDHYSTPYRGDDVTGTAKRAGIVDEVREYNESERTALRNQKA